MLVFGKFYVLTKWIKLNLYFKSVYGQLVSVHVVDITKVFLFSVLVSLS